MIRSMTAFGSGDVEKGDTRYTAEVRTLNHRHRDMVLRLMKTHQSLEEGLRGLISSRIPRGRIEVSFQIEKTGETLPYDVELNLTLAEAYLRVFRQLADHAGVDAKMPLESLLNIKDIILIKPETTDLAAIGEGFQEALNRALDTLDEMKVREGRAILTDFNERLDRLEAHVDAIHVQAPQLTEAYRERVTEKLTDMLDGAPLDENRLVQEVALLAERSDITEETVRIRSHLSQFREYLSMDDAVGRRLDFLIQELHREVNTLGVKAADSAISKRVVEMKAELEKLREQVQNIE